MPAKQVVRDVVPEPNKLGASTPFDFNGKNLTPLRRILVALAACGYRNQYPKLRLCHRDDR
jgi:hypothetical protein